MNFLYERSARMMPDAMKSSFFFNARGARLEKTTIGLYRALLWHILRTFKDLLEVFGEVDLGSIKINGWKERHLMNLLSKVIEKLHSRPLVFYIDALDECVEDQIRLMVTHLRQISKRATQSGSRFKICFSSRHYPNISIANSISLVLEEQPQHESDLRHYIDSELINEVVVEDLKQAIRIRDKLLQKSSGIFLYMKLVIDELKKDFDNGEANVGVLEGRVDELPQGLSALYCDILSKDTENPSGRKAMRLCFQWVLFAHLPLTADMLYFAIQHGLHEGTIICGPLPQSEYKTLRSRMHRFILSSSRGLVEIKRAKGWGASLGDFETADEPPELERFIPQFIHESVRDYLLRENGYQKLYPSSKFQGSFAGKSHDRLKEICYKGTHLIAHHRESESALLSQSNPPN
ncbi:hypothetical protein F5B19DRAFT_481074 [Rostrohypoxylon terebratum]|nr:hypothetical protein F5B19DRAFT_481074 [Rostrohypoxylon terebratum]